MKASSAQQAIKLTDIPNIGAETVKDFEILNIRSPKQLVAKDAFVLYKKLCAKTGVHHDPCVIDVFLSAIDFMQGAQATPWWKYTKLRKAHPEFQKLGS